MLKTAPGPIDVQEFQFKLRCRLKVFDNKNAAQFANPCNLVASASRFGLLFAGTNTPEFQVIQLKDLESYSKSDGEVGTYPRRTVTLPSAPSYLSTNCEHTILAVIVHQDGSPWVLFYNVKSFWEESPINHIERVRLSASPGVNVVDVNWNPTLGAIFTACKSDGTLGVYELKNPGVEINELPAAAGATCFCWSPKGKQIAVGSADGKITQYKPDLKAVKVTNAPQMTEPHFPIALQWVSNFQFIGVYKSSNSGIASVLVVDAQKNGELSYTNYDDICYSNGNTRPSQFYTIVQQNWNVLMVASANSIEVGVLGNSGDKWVQWIMSDSGRAELPLSTDHQETLPIGFAMEIGATQPIPWGEGTIPAAPILLFLSHFGVLCCFDVINLDKKAPSICSPPDPIANTSGAKLFIAKPAEQPKPVPQIAPPEAKITPAKPSLFGAFSAAPTSLFGGQATLTPITQKSAPPLYPNLPLYPSLPTTDNSNITPAMPTIPIMQPKAPPVLSGTTIVPLVQPKGPASIAPLMPKVPTVELNIPKVVNKLPVASVIAEKPKETEVSVVKEVDEETEAIFAQMLKEERDFLETEVRVTLHQGQTLRVSVGSDNDHTNMARQTTDLVNFCKEIDEICSSQNSEVHTLKQNLVQSWAWYEEAKSRQLDADDPSKTTICKILPLDAGSEKQLDDIQRANYYLQSQLAQAHLALDEEWDQFQDYCKKSCKLEIPTVELIFQTMVKQNAIIQKQSYLLKDIASRVMSKSRSTLGGSSLIAIESLRGLDVDLKRLNLEENIVKMQYDRALNRSISTCSDTRSALEKFLNNRTYREVLVMDTEMSSILQASPSTKVRDFSLLGAKMSPVAKESIPKKPDFIQSTPKPTVLKFDSPENKTAIEGLQNFTTQFDSNFKKEKSFTPVAKNVIASSPNSAFVATSFGAVPITKPASTAPKVLPSYGIPTTSMPLKGQPVISISAGTVKASASAPEITAALQKPSLFGASGLSSGSKTFNFSSGDSKPSIFGTAISSTPKASAFSNTFGGDSLFSNTTKPGVVKAVPETIFGAVSDTKSSTAVVPPSVSITPVVSKSTFSGGLFKSATVGTSPLNLSTSVTAKGDSITITPVSKVGTSETSKPIFGGTGLPIKKAILANTEITPVQSIASDVTITPKLQISVFSGTGKNAFGTGTTQSSIFGSSPSVTTSLLSAALDSTSSVSSTTPSIFGSGGTTASTPFFGLGSGTTTSSIFASTVLEAPTTTTTVTTASSVFGAVSSATSIFGAQAPTTAPFGALPSTTTAAPIFGSVTSTTASSFGVSPGTTAASVFGSASPSTTVSSVFGTTPASTAVSSVFGAAPLTTTTVSVFGAVLPTTTATSVFGAVPPTTTTTPSAFGAVPPTTTATSVFGAVPPTTTTTPSAFGAVPPTTTATSVFGAVPPTTTTTPSVFGAVSPATTAVPPAFGASTPSSTSSVFGATSAPAAFGASAATTTPSVFGSPSSTVFGSATSTSSVFGAPTSTASVFGGATPATSTPSAFGTVSTSSPFGGAPAAFSEQPPAFGAQQSVFGGASPAAPAFGGFGGASPAKTSIFGAAPATTSAQGIFGGTAPTSTFGGSSFGGTTEAGFGQSPFGAPATFGQSTTSIFGKPAATTSASIFGGTPTTTSSFGGSVFGSPATSSFGSSNAFASSTTSNAFGFGGLNVDSSQNSNSGFGKTPSANPFGGAAEQKSPFGGDSKSIFGSSSTPSSSIFGGATTTAFGGASNSGFGQQPAFGQSAFGSGPFTQSSAGPFGGASAGPFSGSSAGPFSGSSAGTVAQSGFGASATFQKSPGFGGSPVIGSSTAFGSAPSFGGAPAFGSTATSFGSPTKMFGGPSTGFGAAPTAQNPSFGNLANQPTVGFGNLAQQASSGSSGNTPFAGASSFTSWRQ